MMIRPAIIRRRIISNDSHSWKPKPKPKSLRHTADPNSGFSLCNDKLPLPCPVSNKSHQLYPELDKGHKLKNYNYQCSKGLLNVNTTLNKGNKCKQNSALINTVSHLSLNAATVSFLMPDTVLSCQSSKSEGMKGLNNSSVCKGKTKDLIWERGMRLLPQSTRGL